VEWQRLTIRLENRQLGSRRFDDPPPFEATPVWRRGADGPPANYDVALHLDFDDWDSYRQYSPRPVHQSASAFNGAVSWDELDRRVTAPCVGGAVLMQIPGQVTDGVMRTQLLARLC
jgi:hypothetical protein